MFPVGSACSSGLTKASHVLIAISNPEEYLYGSLRVTFGKNNTKEEVDYLLNSLMNVI